MFNDLLNISEYYITIGYAMMVAMVVIVCGAYMSFIERRLLALFQNRYGPNRVGWNGSLQLLADFIKIMFKEDWIPPFADSYMFVLAPVIAFIISLVNISIIPFTSTGVILNSSIGILFFIMISSLSIYSILFAGWSSNNKYAIIASVRATAQTLTYEVFLGLSLMGVVAQSGSFNLLDIVENQRHVWNIIPQFLGFIIFFIAGTALCHRHPFDQPESEQELSSGYHIEYSGIKFSLFFISEYINIISVSSLMVTLFFGGWMGPGLSPIIWFVGKTFILVILFILIRASLPRPRYDHAMLLGWKLLFPLALLNLLVTAIVILI